MTDIPLRANSGRPAVELRASGLAFSVSTMLRDVMRCSCAYSHLGSYGALVRFIAFELVCSRCLRRPRARRCIAVGIYSYGTQKHILLYINSNSDRIKNINGMMKKNI